MGCGPRPARTGAAVSKSPLVDALLIRDGVPIDPAQVAPSLAELAARLESDLIDAKAEIARLRAELEPS
jgi:hypothetical protein